MCTTKVFSNSSTEHKRSKRYTNNRLIKNQRLLIVDLVKLVISFYVSGYFYAWPFHRYVHSIFDFPE